MSQTASKILRTNSWANGKGALLITGGVGVFMALLALAITLIARVPVTTTAGLFQSNSLPQVLVNLLLGILVFVNLKHNISLVLSMGVTRKAYLLGVLRVALINASLVTAFFVFMAFIENVTHGYGIYWYVFSANFEHYSFYALDLQPYTARTVWLGAVYYACLWFISVVLTHLTAILLVLVSLRWNFFATVLAATLVVLGIWLYVLTGFSASLNFGITFPDLGYWEVYNDTGSEMQLHNYAYNAGVYENIREIVNPHTLQRVIVRLGVAALALVLLYAGNFKLMTRVNFR